MTDTRWEANVDSLGNLGTSDHHVVVASTLLINLVLSHPSHPLSPLYQRIHCSSNMTDNFRQSIMNRLPAMPPPMAPTKAPWAQTGKDDIEELEGEGEDAIGELRPG